MNDLKRNFADTPRTQNPLRHWTIMKILIILFFFEIKESKITRGYNYTLVKKQSRLYVRKYSFSQRTINVWNTLSTDCVHASSVNNIHTIHTHIMSKNKIDKYLVKAGYI